MSEIKSSTSNSGKYFLNDCVFNPTRTIPSSLPDHDFFVGTKEETSDVLKAVKWNRGLVHGFSYSQSELEFFLDLGWYISFNGEVTYAGKKGAADMAELINYVPKDRILIESDSPYYAPVPLRNTSNTPNNISYIYDYVASKRETAASKLAASVEENCRKLFLS